MLSLVLGSSPAGFTHCRVHQRAWVAALDRWVAFHVPTRDGNPVTDGPCDYCLVLPHGTRRMPPHAGPGDGASMRRGGAV